MAASQELQICDILVSQLLADQAGNGGLLLNLGVLCVNGYSREEGSSCKKCNNNLQRRILLKAVLVETRSPMDISICICMRIINTYLKR